jgi:hypothetical protein
MTGLIELKLSNLNQLFNSMDPSPFHERDLDANAEEFIVSWAMEHPRQDELGLVIHLSGDPPPATSAARSTWASPMAKLLINAMKSFPSSVPSG